MLWVPATHDTVGQLFNALKDDFDDCEETILKDTLWLWVVDMISYYNTQSAPHDTVRGEITCVNSHEQSDLTSFIHVLFCVLCTKDKGKINS